MFRVAGRGTWRRSSFQKSIPPTGGGVFPSPVMHSPRSMTSFRSLPPYRTIPSRRLIFQRLSITRERMKLPCSVSGSSRRNPSRGFVPLYTKEPFTICCFFSLCFGSIEFSGVMFQFFQASSFPRKLYGVIQSDPAFHVSSIRLSGSAFSVNTNSCSTLCASRYGLRTVNDAFFESTETIGSFPGRSRNG